MSRHRSTTASRRAALGVLLGAVVVLPAPVALASRAPTSVEQKAIARAVQGFYGQWYYGNATRKVAVSAIRISTANGDWASAQVAGAKAPGRPALNGPYRVVLLWHATGSPGSGTGGPGGRQWIVAEAGAGMGEYFGCAIAPPAVTADLFRSINGGC